MVEFNEWIRTPILDALEKYQSIEKTSLHVPGHKGGRGLPSDFAKYAGLIARIDATELRGLDDLHHPQEAILEAQKLAAYAWGSEETFFLVGGSTVGNLVAIKSLIRPGDKVIVARNCHQSVWHALDLAQARMVTIMPELMSWSPGPISPDTVQEAIFTHPDAVAVILTSPTYHGVVSDVKTIVQLAHAKGMKVIVDEAHGAHLAFHPGLPPSAVQSGADVIVQSTHKMIAALTQTGLLHVNGTQVDRENIQCNLRIFQTSSPSYVLLASIDSARAQLVLQGQALLENALANLTLQRTILDEMFQGLIDKGSNPQFMDPFKWTLNTERWGMSGNLFATTMEEQGIYPELYDEHHVLFAWSYGNTKEDVVRVSNAIGHAFREKIMRPQDGELTSRTQVIPSISQVLSSVQDKALQNTRLGTLAEAEGLKAAKAVTVYPPGVPVVLPGEVYTPLVLQYIAKSMEYKVRVDGVTGEPEGRVWLLVE